ncbi:NnrS family protein [Roseibium suaedae]|uniref:Uncharacterized protein involved in response to NO n=1 Tax=Roseibium suaedae TaxID=735517 RepID=A0A1M7NWW5_9HYPH|nr:NnrS family protein [Roseibium suaedae]SHN08612.1 uncharacterized protein involved in response to NO [Roseibium suaedae]
MAKTAQAYQGPHWLSGGFRPFFLAGALAMAAPVLIWLPFYFGDLTLPTAFAPRDWHVHTLLFGGVPAIIAGFALTAVANWTGRPAVSGAELLALLLLWCAGRVAVSISALIGAPLAAAIDLMFLISLSAVFAREVVAARNYRNLRVVGIVALLALANLGFHAEAYSAGVADYSLRAGLSLVLLLILVIGGRIIPAFTRNWLAARKAVKLPAPFGKGDAVIMGVSALALAAWTILPLHLGTAALLLLAGAGNVWRLARWRGFATRQEPLLFILHIAYGILCAGFLAVACSILNPGHADPAAALHLWTAGSVGLMTLAVMTRASRGHSGQPLTASRMDLVLFGLILVGTFARAAAPYLGEAMRPLLDVAGLAWAGGYLVFAAGYARWLLLPPAYLRMKAA